MVVRTPIEGDAGDFFIEGVWFDESKVDYEVQTGFCYDVLTVEVK